MLFSFILILVQISIAQNLITNGGFENQIEMNPDCYKENCESTDTRIIAPWILVGASSQFKISGASLEQIQGRVSVHLNLRGAYIIGQNILTTPSESYIATFQLGSNFCSPENRKVGYIQASGNPRLAFEAKPVAWDRLVEYRFTATVANTLLEIGSTTVGSCGPRIDDVRVVLASTLNPPVGSPVVNPVVNPVVPTAPNNPNGAKNPTTNTNSGTNVNSSPNTNAAPSSSSPSEPTNSISKEISVNGASNLDETVDQTLSTSGSERDGSHASLNAASNRISTGNIIGIVASCIGGVLLIGGTVFGYRKYQTKISIRKEYEYDAKTHWENLMQVS